MKASFFLTGRFYANAAFRPLITGLVKDGNYLGSHSDGHLLYCDWNKRDSLFVTQEQFSKDIQSCYRKMRKFGIGKTDAPFFLPPYEWYNKSIVNWSSAMGLHLVNFTHGTRSNADYTFPEMGKSYVNSDKIYRSIMDYEVSNPAGLNGFILLFHIGTDPRRTDKFYNRLDELLNQLEEKGYVFKRIGELLKE